PFPPRARPSPGTGRPLTPPAPTTQPSSSSLPCERHRHGNAWPHGQPSGPLFVWGGSILLARGGRNGVVAKEFAAGARRRAFAVSPLTAPRGGLQCIFLIS